MSTNECLEQSTSQNSQRKIRGFWCEPSPPIPYEEGMKAWQEAQKKAQNYEVKCALCKENGDPPEVYSSHKLRDEKGRVQCPILRKYKCRVCHATGDNAHTISYCPMKDQLVDKEFFGPQYFHNMVGLKKAPFNSAGMQKKNYSN